jgi:hypothetical protein
MTDEEHKWIETNNSVCALLRQAHDVLAMSSFPPRRTWVGLTDEEVESYWGWEDFQCGCGKGTLLEMVRDIEAALKERNT